MNDFGFSSHIIASSLCIGLLDVPRLKWLNESVLLLQTSLMAVCTYPWPFLEASNSGFPLFSVAVRFSSSQTSDPLIHGIAAERSVLFNNCRGVGSNSSDVGLQGVSAGGLDWKDDPAAYGKDRRKHRYNYTGRQRERWSVGILAIGCPSMN